MPRVTLRLEEIEARIAVQQELRQRMARLYRQFRKVHHATMEQDTEALLTAIDGTVAALWDHHKVMCQRAGERSGSTPNWAPSPGEQSSPLKFG